MNPKATPIPSTDRLLTDAAECVLALTDAMTLRYYLHELGQASQTDREVGDYLAIVDRHNLPLALGMGDHLGDHLDNLQQLALTKAGHLLKEPEVRKRLGL